MIVMITMITMITMIMAKTKINFILAFSFVVFPNISLGCSNVAKAASGRPFLNHTFEVLTVFCHSRHRHLVSRVMTRGWSDLPEAHITPKCW